MRWWSDYGRTATMSCTWQSCLPAFQMRRSFGQANARGALLLTADRDFGELVFRQKLVHSGVVLVRLAGITNTAKVEIVSEVCRQQAPELLGAFSVISPGQVRIRRSS